MTIKTKPGLFVVIEGIDNCGKTTQATLLREYFTKHDRNTVQVREPGGTEVAEEIRSIFLKDRDEIMFPYTQTLLIMAARSQILKYVIKPAMDDGKIVITDRFYPSTYVYQILTQGVDRSFIDAIEQHLEEITQASPDLIIILDIPVDVSLSRNENADRATQKTIYEKQGRQFAEKLRQGYLEFAKKFPDNSYVIDGTLSKEMVHQQILELVSQSLDE